MKHSLRAPITIAIAALSPVAFSQERAAPASVGTSALASASSAPVVPSVVPPTNSSGLAVTTPHPRPQHGEQNQHAAVTDIVTAYCEGVDPTKLSATSGPADLYQRVFSKLPRTSDIVAAYDVGKNDSRCRAVFLAYFDKAETFIDPASLCTAAGFTESSHAAPEALVALRAVVVAVLHVFTCRTPPPYLRPPPSLSTWSDTISRLGVACNDGHVEPVALALAPRLPERGHHRLALLAGRRPRGPPASPAPVWGTPCQNGVERGLATKLRGQPECGWERGHPNPSPSITRLCGAWTRTPSVTSPHEWFAVIVIARRARFESAGHSASGRRRCPDGSTAPRARWLPRLHPTAHPILSERTGRCRSRRRRRPPRPRPCSHGS